MSISPSPLPFALWRAALVLAGLHLFDAVSVFELLRERAVRALDDAVALFQALEHLDIGV